MTASVRTRGLLGAVSPRQTMLWCVSVGMFFVGWELLGRSGLVISVVPVTEVMPTLVENLKHGELLPATIGTLHLAGVGFLVGAGLGVAIGLIMGLSPTITRVLDPLVSSAYSAPAAVFIPVLSIYLGMEMLAKVVLVVIFNIFVVILNTAAGVREVSPQLVEAGRAFGARGVKLYRAVVLRAASPSILTGLRLCLGRSIQGAVLADVFLRAQHFGLYIRQAQGAFLLAELLAAVFFLTAISLAAMGLARMVELRLLRWTH